MWMWTLECEPWDRSKRVRTLRSRLDQSGLYSSVNAAGPLFTATLTLRCLGEILYIQLYMDWDRKRLFIHLFDYGHHCVKDALTIELLRLRRRAKAKVSIYTGNMRAQPVTLIFVASADALTIELDWDDKWRLHICVQPVTFWWLVRYSNHWATWTEMMSEVTYVYNL